MGRFSSLAFITCIGLLASTETVASGQTRLTHPELKRMVRAALDQNRPLDDLGAGEDLQGPQAAFPAIYSKPIIELRQDAVYYNFGYVNVGNATYDLNRAGVNESWEDGYSMDVGEPLGAREVPDVPLLPDVDAAMDESLPDEEGDPFARPLRGQFLVELIRKYRNSPSAREAWAPHLADAEKVIAKELDIIYAAGRQDDESPASESDRKLADCDEMVQRLVVGYLDKLALERGQIVRKEEAYGAPALYQHQVQLSAEPPGAELYYRSEWDYYFLSLRPGGAVHDLKNWRPAPPEGIEIAGRCRFLAVWKEEGRVRSSGFVQKNITKDEVVRLVPRDSWPPQSAP